ncbi:type-F conjugative transfer system secretin TraK [uncultured Microbulbifer sp.]|uniref:TraK domain-containing protein n=1 Tax=uncultured Microbulbifer sp. TaxID=348147 RepID=UPI0026260E32|nr:type-F conjugative transfer system secretin TraK [uncultured Microbulbifer sp.]
MKTWILIVLLGWSVMGAAQQRYPVKDGETVLVTVSRYEMNRMTAEGENRLEGAVVIKGEYEVLNNKELNEGLFIKPKNDKPFSFFLEDNMGNTFTVVAEPKNVPSQTIIFQGKAKPIAANERARFRGDPHLQRIADLNKAMSNRTPLKGYNRYDHDAKRDKVWPDTELRLVMTYESAMYLGEIFELRNISSNTITYREEDFMNFGNGVLAVGLEHLTVPTNRRTFVFVTRSAEAVDYVSAAK